MSFVQTRGINVYTNYIYVFNYRHLFKIKYSRMYNVMIDKFFSHDENCDVND